MAKKKEFTLDPARKGTLWADMTPSEQQYIKDRQKSDGACQFKIPDIVWTTVGTCAWLPKGAYWPLASKETPSVVFNLDPRRKGTCWCDMTGEERQYLRCRAVTDGGVMVWQANGTWMENGTPGWVRACKYWLIEKEKKKEAFVLDPARKGMVWAMMTAQEQATIKAAFNKVGLALYLNNAGQWTVSQSLSFLPDMAYWAEEFEPKPKPAYKAEYDLVHKLGSTLSLGPHAGMAIVGQAGPNGTTVAGFAQTEKLAQRLVEHWRQYGRLTGGLDRLLHGRPLFEGKLRQPWAVCVEIPDSDFPTKQEGD